MFRAFFIFLSKVIWAQKLIMDWGFAWKAASRFIAGTTTADAIQVVKKLNDQGFHVTLDHLGENSNTFEDTEASTLEVLHLLDAINENSVQANISIKLSQLGLSIDEQLCKGNLERILEKAKEKENFIRIDMEDSTLTESTINLVVWAKNIYPGIGTVIQSYLYRSEDDVKKLVDNCIPIRMVKGAYKEPAEIAFPKKNDVDLNFDRLVKMILDKISSCNFPEISLHGRFPPLIAVASHDPRRIELALQHAEELTLKKSMVEIQMLYGIRRDLQDYYLKLGHPVRVYVPYGTHWYPYFMRRLAERPANIWFFLSNLFKN
jgi:proline dehydrogenase